MPHIVTWAEMARMLPRLNLMGAIEDGFAAYSRGEAIVPPVGELLFPRGEAHIKYGYIKGDASFTIKVATGFYDNPSRGLPSSDGVFLLLDATTGATLAVLLDEGRLTDIRTAVAGAIAAKYLAPKAVEALGVIGTGIQARLQVEYLAPLYACRKVYVWGRSREGVEAFCRAMTPKGYQVVACGSPAIVAARANLIVTTTPSHEPLLNASAVRPGTHITAMGSDTPEKNEIDPALFSRCKRMVADSLAQCLTRGEIHHAVERGIVTGSQIVELGAVIAGTAPGRESDDEITIADLTGVAVQDIKIAQAIVTALEAERTQP